MSRFFVDRPIFAWVLAIVTMLAGVGAMMSLPIAQYPDIAPTQVNIRTSYPGASAQAVQDSVTQVIEQQLTGLDGLLYFSSTSSSRGQVSISATFEKGTDPDTAQVQVQNQVQQALPRLPQIVQQQGVRVTKSNPDFLMLVVLFDETGSRANADIADYMASNLQDQLARIPGVGDANVFGSPYAMRIWLDPERLAGVGLMPGDVISAIQAQNTEVAAGEIGGQPQPETQLLNATVTAQSRLQTPEQFANILIKTTTDGAAVRLRNVARVELGAESYGTIGRMDRHPATGLSISLAPGADALTTAALVKERVAELAPGFPTGLRHEFVNDTTAFIKLSINEVIVTLIEAIILVVIVMFVFLRSWRATLIPAIAVPVVLLGTLAIFAMAGFSINTMTMFGMVLAIGLLVDDAIVVVENVERLMEENPGMSARDATIQSMGEIQMALVAVALALSVVFLPMAFFGGSTGVIYRQFSLTIIAAMALSVFVALILSPALTASLLKPRHGGAEGRVARLLDRFGAGIEAGTHRYVALARGMVDRKWLFVAIYAGVAALLVLLFMRLPTGFLPNEDQGNVMVQVRLPAGATLGRTLEVQRAAEDYFLTHEKEALSHLYTVAGGMGGGGTSGQNVGTGFVRLRHWDERPGQHNSAEAISGRAMKALSGLRDAQVFTTLPPPVRGLGQSAGFTMQMLNTGGLPLDQFTAARDAVLAEAKNAPALTSVRLTDLPDTVNMKIDIDHHKLAALGLAQSDVNTTLSAAWGGRYVNDFVDRGRVKRVYVQADAPWRDAPQDLDAWFVRARDGQMAPFSAFARASWSTAPSSLSRFQGVPAFEIQGQAAPGTSSGQAMDTIEAIARRFPGISVAWSGVSYQERLSSGQAPLLYGISLLVVFLCLAALYESWTIPVAVLMIIPLGLVGAVFAVTLRGLNNDIYLQIGLLTTMGLAAKNAILMIEFADRAEKTGMRIIDAAMQAARVRLRPILMTSFAFIFGVLPLALSTGAGANSRIAIGTSVIGGMLTATMLAIFYIPLFFVMVRRTTRDTLGAMAQRIRGTLA